MAAAPRSTTHDGGPHDPVLIDLLTSWAPRQRWFPAKGTAVALEHVTGIRLEDPAGEGAVTLHLFRLPSGAVLQVPVVVRAGTVDGPGLIGALPGAPAVVDGCHDPAFVRAWLAAAEHDAQDPGTGDVGADLTGMRVLTGEQSNTSVLLPGTSPPSILKVFRGVSTGHNPDVEVPLAMSRLGWAGVPRPLAWVTGRWPAVGGAGHDEGHLGVLSELITDAEDGFELACRWAAAGQDLGTLAEDLGRTTAQMHQALREALPVDGGTGPVAAAPERVVQVLRERAASAVAAAPPLASRAERIAAVYAELERLTGLPPVQRVHGDYHLGQVLHSEHRGWTVLDFEGEPQASAAERTRPDLALRDLAGMLRSLDYAGAVGGATPSSWVPAARDRLVAGYLATTGGAADDRTTATLLRALELDKALYEVVYETRNRPTWVHIPLEGVDRLLRS
jgi:maltokinase